MNDGIDSIDGLLDDVGVADVATIEVDVRNRRADEVAWARQCEVVEYSYLMARV